MICLSTDLCKQKSFSIVWDLLITKVPSSLISLMSSLSLLVFMANLNQPWPFLRWHFFFTSSLSSIFSRCFEISSWSPGFSTFLRYPLVWFFKLSLNHSGELWHVLQIENTIMVQDWKYFLFDFLSIQDCSFLGVQ